MSRLCRLKSYKNIGEDGVWAYNEITKLRAELAEAKKQRDELMAALETIARSLPQIACERAQMMDYANKVIASVKDAAMRTTEESSVDGETK
jgi:F0F1-type ATP synthase membrane subunit b/b'